MVNSYILINGFERYKKKKKDPEIKATLLFLDNVSKIFSSDNMKKLDYMDMSMIFQLITILLIMMIFQICKDY